MTFREFVVDTLRDRYVRAYIYLHLVLWVGGTHVVKAYDIHGFAAFLVGFVGSMCINHGVRRVKKWNEELRS